MASYAKVYSDYEIKESAIKFNGENEIATTKVGCVGSLTEEMDVRTVTKKCEGVVIKSYAMEFVCESIWNDIHR